MSEQSLDKLISIYEGLEFSKTLPDDYNPQIESIKLQVKTDIHTIEVCISGLINYYNQLKSRAETVPTDTGNVQELSNLKQLIVKNLSWAKEFK